MPSDAFEQVVKAYLEELQAKLSAEHRLALRELEARSLAAEDENRQLRRRSELRTELAGEGALFTRVRSSLGGSSPVPPAVCAEPSSEPVRSGSGTVFDELHAEAGQGQRPASSGAAGAQLAASVPGALEGPPAAQGGGEAQEQQRRPSVHWDHVPSITHTPQADEVASQCSNGGLNFRVHDVWMQKPTSSSRKISLHSFERLSNGSRSRLGSDISYVQDSSSSSSEDEDDEGRRCTKRCALARLQRHMLPPGSVRYLLWEIVGICFIAYDIVVIPLQILEPPRNSFMTAMSWFVRMYWTLDIAVSFLTGYVSAQGVVELKPARVAQHYVRTRLGLDLLLVSCDWAGAIVEAAGGGQGGAVLRLVGALRAVRLVRLGRMVKSQKIFELAFQRVRSEGVMLVAYIIAVMVLLLGLIHATACVWHGIRDGAEGEAEARAAPGESPGEQLWRQYTEDFHYVLALFAGEHLQEPRSLLERIFTIVVLVFAFVVSAAFVGSLTTAMTRLQIIASKRSTQFAALSRYLKDYGISCDLAARVQRNARHALREQKRHTPESSVELMRLISDPLRSEIHYEVFSPMIMAHPFFRLYNVVNPAGVRHICHTTVHTQSLSRGDVIFSQYELPVSPKMFFLASGRVLYLRGIDQEQTVTCRQWVAEAVLWTKWLHRGTLRALTESRVLAVDAARLGNIMSTFPSRHGSSYASSFVDELNQIDSASDLTDMPTDAEQHARHIATCVFQEIDRHFEVPPEWRGRSTSIFSRNSLRSNRQSIFDRHTPPSSRRPSTDIVPTKPG